MKFVLIFLFLFTSVFLQAQSVLFTKQVNASFFLKYNAFRNTEKLDTLQQDSNLFMAAEKQCIYMSDKNLLTHSQPNKKFKSPYVRVNYFGENFNCVAENALYLTFEMNESKENAELLALNMFNLWLNSKEHYKNMSSKTYSHTAIAIMYNEKRKLMYATQVFGGYRN